MKDLDDFLADKGKNGEEITPWFKLIMESKLIPWWKKLEQTGSFPQEAD